jgi:hypothetical protein
MKQIFLTAIIPANSVGYDVTPSIVKQAPYQRLINGMGISGATVNTAKLHILKNNLEVMNIANGVTRTAGQPIDFVSDLVPVGEFLEANDQITFAVDNTTAGTLTYYVAFDIDEEQ